MKQSVLLKKNFSTVALLLVATTCGVWMSERALNLTSYGFNQFSKTVSYDPKATTRTISIPGRHRELLSFYGADLWRKAKARNLGATTEVSIENSKPARELQSSECPEGCYSLAPTPSPTCSDGGTNCDPIILGIEGQVFKFEGRGGTWYSNLAVPDASVHWNTYFHKFPGCPSDEDTFIAGAAISIPGEEIMVAVDDKDSFFPGCLEGESTCLGDGSLSLTINGLKIHSPGEYPLRNGGSVVVYNTYAACSRKWYDFKESRRALQTVESRGKQDLAIELLRSKEGTMIDPEECSEWIAKRAAYNDLFDQQGGWSTIHVVTPHLSMHMEYRQTRQICFSHNLDSWISNVSPALLKHEWKGILGETRYPIYDSNGDQIISDRNRLLAGKYDSNYEVEAPFGTQFEALDLALVASKERRLDGCLEEADRRALSSTSSETTCICPPSQSPSSSQSPSTTCENNEEDALNAEGYYPSAEYFTEYGALIDELTNLGNSSCPFCNDQPGFEPQCVNIASGGNRFLRQTDHRSLAISAASCNNFICARWIADEHDAALNPIPLPGPPDIPDCPCNQLQNNPPPAGWTIEGAGLHDGADFCMRNSGAPPVGGGWIDGGQQCCYLNGALITGGIGAGTPDRASPIGVIGKWNHWCLDVRPFFACSCDTYLTLRPPNNGNNCPALVVNPC